MIVLPAERPSSLLNGHAPGTIPAEFAGGMGTVGVRALEVFVRKGGTLVALNQASDLAIEELHLPVDNVVKNLSRQDFFSSGSIFEVDVDTRHPAMAGMPEQGKIFFDRSPVFSTQEGFQGSALMKYRKSGTPLLSGYLLGEEHLQGYAAALDVKYGEGRIILLGLRPQWRGQPFGTFKILFNSILFTDELARSSSGDGDFWEVPQER